MSSGIINQLDRMLADDKNFDTRAGLLFMTQLVRDAFLFIESEKARAVDEADKLKSFENRIRNVENGLSEFLKKRETEQAEAADERKWWRRLFMGGIFTLLLSEIVQWLIG